jgi:thiamine biosynthesis lipoprotein
VISLGGDVSVGRPAGAAPIPWQITIAERPDDPPQATVTLTEGGLATSTVMARRWVRAGQQLHHVLDPATGRSVDPLWRTATVRATTCLAANAASTATVIMGSTAQRWLSGRGLAARLVARDGSVHPVGDWQEEGN